MGLYQLLEDTARSFPDRSASVCCGSTWTYGHLKERVVRLAAAFRSLGIKKGDRVAIVHQNCHVFLESYFATAGIGAVLVPINYRLSSKEISQILEDSGSSILIIQDVFITSELKSQSGFLRLKSILLTGSSDTIFGPEGFLSYEAQIGNPSAVPVLEESIQDSDAAQIYYTSGTTGRPKGVVLTHGNNRRHAQEAVAEFGLSGRDNWLHVSPMFHLADAWAVWAVTMAAGTHVIIPCFEIRAVFEAIEEHKVTLSNFIPTMLNLLVKDSQFEKYDLSSLRLVLSGGAPIAPEVVRQVLGSFGCDYMQTYGLTETSPFLTISKLRDNMADLSWEEKFRIKVTTGRPFSSVELKVVKADGSEVEADGKDVGEVIAKGATITPGYWNLEEETSRRIVDGWLHTRDLAVVNSDGYITLVDRMDDVINTGGENVYSVEVENVLYTHPQILEAAVIGLPDPIWGETVAAVVVPKKGVEIEEDEIMRYCMKRLTAFKSPKKVFFTDSLPKTGSAKIYKYRLREKYSRAVKGF
jgi:fatty-acyl-CoA synthase